MYQLGKHNFSTFSILIKISPTCLTKAQVSQAAKRVICTLRCFKTKQTASQTTYQKGQQCTQMYTHCVYVVNFKLDFARTICVRKITRVGGIIILPLKFLR